MGGPFDADAEAHFDEVAEAFAKLTNVDRDVGVDLEKELCMTVEADDRSDALVTRRLLPRVPRCIPLAARLAPGTIGCPSFWNPIATGGASRQARRPAATARPDTVDVRCPGPVISHEGTPARDSATPDGLAPQRASQLAKRHLIERGENPVRRCRPARRRCRMSRAHGSMGSRSW
ncbi:Conserved protein of unknown function (part2) [Mycobacterium canettii CIPT 140070008]|nr:Conserved protein of unknown function (part2) [Mycobacterium canettii CIPT 140070008]